ncbi:FABP family protein [Jatrophihabitans sp.]|uniref:FABP family protein n=1 Tax=Jatrophihabitans sp. TaxID=1932789 RepID=UPI002B9606F3|nr:FABP family protein [Jatrophihabitans sp.]
MSQPPDQARPAGDDPAVPEPADTTDLRSGPELNSALLAVLPLVGRWSGSGHGAKPATGEQFRYAQRVSFAHDGRPFLSYESRTWLLNPDGSVLRPAFRENGFLRMGAGGAGTTDELELVLATAVGIVEVFTGVAGDARWELAASGVGFTPSAKQIAGERRLYALTGEQLSYVQELALTPGDYRPHLNATLTRD